MNASLVAGLRCLCSSDETLSRREDAVPLQNRVTPWGEIVALPERGLFMGNRGCLRDGQRRVVRQWARNPWVTGVGPVEIHRSEAA